MHTKWKAIVLINFLFTFLCALLILRAVATVIGNIQYVSMNNEIYSTRCKNCVVVTAFMLFCGFCYVMYKAFTRIYFFPPSWHLLENDVNSVVSMEKLRLSRLESNWTTAMLIAHCCGILPITFSKLLGICSDDCSNSSAVFYLQLSIFFYICWNWLFIGMFTCMILRCILPEHKD